MRALPETEWHVYDEFGCKVSLSKYGKNYKMCSRGITNMKELTQKIIQREMIFQDILYRVPDDVV